MDYGPDLENLEMTWYFEIYCRTNLVSMVAKREKITN
jgi:hypothetical protein